MEYAVNFGQLGKSEPVKPGAAFRLALLGDFSGRAGAGEFEIGDALASRKAIKVDIDNFDQVMARLKPKVVLDLGTEGSVSVPIGELDDFHPDQLVENLEFFEQLLDLRRNLQSKAGFAQASKEVLSWAGEEALPMAREKPRGMAVPTDRKLSDFARLTGRKARGEVEVDDLVRRLIGPYIEPGRDSRQDALVARVDEALSAAMRRVLHNPEFQTAEALWRSVDMLVRRIETGAKMQIVLYDITAEELAADLAASDDLEESGLYKLLVEQTALDANQGGLSLIAGLYQWELTPPHADLLGRMAQVCMAAGAPFLSSIAPDPLREKQHEWHPLIQQAWAALQELPASAKLGLATPRFLLRMPYGKRTDPIDAFAFEEFTRQGGLSGMLWGNPAVLLALTISETFDRGAELGSIASVNELPVYVYVDQDGDQIALPCTERLFTERIAAQVGGLGVIPVVSMRGRPEVRVASFGAVNGKPLAGRWKIGETTKKSIPAKAAPEPAAEGAEEEAPAADTSELDALLAGMDEEAAPEAAPEEAASPELEPEPEPEPEAAPEPVAEAEPEPEAAAEAPAAEDADLDSLLAGLSEEPEAAAPAPEPEAAAPAAAEDDLDALLASLNPPPAEPTADEAEADLDALLASLK